MKKSEIKVGGLYVAKVGNNITTVRVDAIREVEGRTIGTSYWAKTTHATTMYDVTNVKTGRKTTFRSAMKFRHVSRQGTISDQTIQNRVAQIEAKYSTEQGATEAERQEAQDLVEITPETTKEERTDLLASELAADRSKLIEEMGGVEVCKVHDPVMVTLINKTLIIHDQDTSEGKKQLEDAVALGRTLYDPSVTTVETTTVGIETNIRYGIDVPVAVPVAIGCRPLSGLAARLATQPKDHPHIIVEARAGTGKCLGRGTPVLMFDGTIKEVEHVVQGDVLMGPDSTPRNVLNTCADYGELYRILPVKGDPWICNDAHILTLMGSNHVMGQIRDVCVRDFVIEQETNVPNADSWKLFRVPVDFQPPTAKLPIQPYLVGLWFGDGTRGTSSLTNSNEIIQNYCTKAAAELGLICKIYPDRSTYRIDLVSCNKGDSGQVIGGNQARTFFLSCTAGVLKKIPHSYLTASRQDRLELLAGIIDTDGETTGNSNTFVTVTGELYRDDLLLLVRSLGFAAYVGKTKVHTCANGKVSTYYQISIAGDLDRIPTLVRKFPPRRQIKRVLVTGFEIEDAGQGDYFGFTLDGDGRFLLGDFTVTHNTTTIVAGIVYTFRDKIPGLWVKMTETLGFELVPSPQQQVVWDAMKLSADAKSVQMTAFNKAIVREFETKWGWVVEALRGAGITLQFATNHSMGYASIRKAFNQRLEVSEYRVTDLIASITNTDVRELRKKKFEMLKATEKLVGLCKMNLASTDEESLAAIASHYDIELNGCRREVFDLVPRVLEACKDPTRDGRIDYDDMVWLPVALDLPMYRNDLLLVDEAQDLNRCQQALAKKAGKRLVLVGDPKQAIYGFAGADAESMPRMDRELSDTKQGCNVLPLTVTRRCGHAIVKEANRIVADFTAHESNRAGEVSEAAYPTYERDGRTMERPWDECYLSQAQSGDFILCRVNAPLVSNCFRFLKRGIKANIQGRDIGAGLVSTIEKLKAQSIPDLIGKVSDWLQTELSKEQAKRLPSEARMIALSDRADCLVAFTEGATTVASVVDKIKTIFTDDKQGGGIRLSSIHRAKGLEADRVFILQPKGATMPHPMARSDWQRGQEYNLLYVAITRAIKELVYVY